jgi:Flp pilus assembly protein TadB
MTPRPPIKLIALLVLGAVGLALIAVGVTGHTGWTLIVIGFVMLLATLPPIWMIQRSRDRSLR